MLPGKRQAANGNANELPPTDQPQGTAAACAAHKHPPAVVEGAARDVVSQALGGVINLGLPPVLEHAVALDLQPREARGFKLNGGWAACSHRHSLILHPLANLQAA